MEVCMKKSKLLILMGMLPFMFTSCTNNNIEGQNPFQNSQESVGEEQISNSSIIEEIINSNSEEADEIVGKEESTNQNSEIIEEPYYHFNEDISIIKFLPIYSSNIIILIKKIINIVITIKHYFTNFS